MSEAPDRRPMAEVLMVVDADEREEQALYMREQAVWWYGVAYAKPSDRIPLMKQYNVHQLPTLIALDPKSGQPLSQDAVRDVKLLAPEMLRQKWLGARSGSGA
uniref:Thioredoxin-like fold domain-containing protein n=1 Tax=Eutreptiella gymnastica TaxID=73025 RepID=A0A7S4FDS1_9EUGL